jgi:protein YIPF1/2
LLIPSTPGSFLPGSSSTQNAGSSGSGGIGSSKKYLWSIQFYAQFFDVDTSDVLKRCQTAIFPRANFLDVLEGRPDLYGPFWIATTVVLILFMTGTMSDYLGHKGEGHYEYDFGKLSGKFSSVQVAYNIMGNANMVVHTGAAGLIYGYTFILPVGLFLLLKYFGSEAASVLECWALYGYANLIWIPVALISWSPITVLNWVFVGVGFGLSALFLVRNLYPVLSATGSKSQALLIIVVLLHMGLALAIKFLFFKQGSLTAGKPDNKKDPPKKEKGGKKGDDDDDDDDKKMIKLLARTLGYGEWV